MSAKTKSKRKKNIPRKTVKEIKESNTELV